MSIRLGDVARDFEQNLTEGCIRFHEWLGGGRGCRFPLAADFTDALISEW